MPKWKVCWDRYCAKMYYLESRDGKIHKSKAGNIVWFKHRKSADIAMHRLNTAYNESGEPRRPPRLVDGEGCLS